MASIHIPHCIASPITSILPVCSQHYSVRLVPEATSVCLLLYRHLFIATFISGVR